MLEALWVGEYVDAEVILRDADELQIQFFEGFDSAQQHRILSYPVHRGIADASGEEHVHGAVLRILLVRVVLQQPIQAVRTFRQQVDGIDLLEPLPFQCQFFDGGDSEVNEFHHLHEAAQYAKGELVGHQDEGHGLGFHAQPFEHLAQLGSAGFLECLHEFEVNSDIISMELEDSHQSIP